MAVDSKYVVMSGDEIFDVWMIPSTLNELSDRYKEYFNTDDFYVKKVMFGETGVTAGWKYINGYFVNPDDAIDSPFDAEVDERYAFINDLNTVFAVVHMGPGYVADAYNAAYVSENLTVMDITNNLDETIGIGYKLVDGEFVPPAES